MDTIRILVIEIGGADRMLVEALDLLKRDPAISFASPEPQELDEAHIALQSAEIEIVLIVTTEHNIKPVLHSIHDARPDVHIVALTVDACPPHLLVRNPNYAELIAIIKSLAQTSDAEAEHSGRILQFRAPVPVREEAQTVVEVSVPTTGAVSVSDGEGEGGRLSPNLPVVAEPIRDPAALEAIEPALKWVETATRSLLKIWSGKRDETAGFALSWESLERWLAELIRIADVPAEHSERDFRAFKGKLESDLAKGSPLANVARLLDDDPLALKLFLIAASADLDIRFHRLFGALHDDFSRRYPSLGLACAIIAAATPGATPIQIRSELAALGRLRALGLITGIGQTIVAADEPLQIEQWLMDWLVSSDSNRLRGPSEGPPLASSIKLVSPERLSALRNTVRRSIAAHGKGEVNAVLVSGSAPHWLEVEAAALDPNSVVTSLPGGDTDAGAISSQLRRQCLVALLTSRRLVLNVRSGSLRAEHWRILSELAGSFARPPFIVCSHPDLQLAELPDEGIAVASLPAPGLADRRKLVLAAMGGQDDVEEPAAARIAASLPISLELVPDAVTLAFVAADEAGRPGNPDERDWKAGFRRAAGARLPRLVRRIEPQPCPADEEFSCLDAVILPDVQRRQLEELVRHARSAHFVLEDWGFSKLLDGRGIAALFSGESGTGKTTAAHAVASELQADLYAIELSQVVSKYIGETEKNLDLVFEDAESAGAVLLFDEADALFGKRTGVSDAHDRYANIEVAYLLQRMQRFSGLAILTTNASDNLDPAFARRLGFHLQFPRPNAADRLAIWEQSLPIELRASSFSLKQIAFALDVTGGTIRQMALHAAVLAAEGSRKIAFEHVLAGARSQLMKLGLFGDLAKLDSLPEQAEARAA